MKSDAEKYFNKRVDYWASNPKGGGPSRTEIIRAYNEGLEAGRQSVLSVEDVQEALRKIDGKLTSRFYFDALGHWEIRDGCLNQRGKSDSLAELRQVIDKLKKENTP